eukprot:scaffold17564_cov59-Attheya_sp.AAC.6
MQNLGLSTVVATRGLRRALPGWESKSVQISHSDVGRITTKEVGVTVCSLTPHLFNVSSVPGPCIQRDASTLMGFKGHSLFYRPVPS